MQFSDNRFVKDYFSNYKLTIAIIAIIFFWAVVYAVFFHKTFYKSESKIWVKEIKNESFVTNFAGFNPISALTAASNPLLTQIEILNSKQLEQLVVKEIEKKYPGNKVEKVSDLINVDTKAGTDMLEVSFKWNKPEEARDILKIVLEKFESINLELNQKLKKQKREYIDIKLGEIEEKLLQVREKIKAYKSENLINDISIESNRLVQQNIEFSTVLEKLKAKLNKTKASIYELEANLSLEASEALNAVALGSRNITLINLKNELNKSMQQYQFDKIQLAETNPKMVALKNKIDTIKEQIREQIALSLGEYIEAPKVSVFDPVRERLVEQLVNSQTEYIGIMSEIVSLGESIERNKAKQSEIPGKEFILDNLKQEELALSRAFDELRSKQIEAKIQEAETVSNISIIDEPSLPKSSTFPNKLHIFILAILFGTGFSVFASISKTLIEDVCEDINYIEKVTGTEILGIIPWLKELPFEVDEKKEHHIFNIAYKNIISRFMIKCYKEKIKVISFTSTSIKKPASSILYKLSYVLKKLGHKVILLDGDFRIPSLASSVGIKNFITNNFSDLILDIEGRINKKLPVNKESIMKTIVYDKEGVAFLANKDPVFEPYEFFGTLAYNGIISVLKEEFDWVFIDTPAAHVFPEFFILSKQADGVIILINKTVSVSDFTHTVEQIKKNKIPIIGTIIRQVNSKLEKEYENYLQQMFDKMLIENEIDDLNLKDLEPEDLEKLIEEGEYD